MLPSLGKQIKKEKESAQVGETHHGYRLVLLMIASVYIYV